jgi:hypothetical protein
MRLIESSELPAMTARTSQRETSGFDADEIAWPALTVHGGAWRLAYAGRRGTRWAIGVLVSDQLIRFRAPVDGSVLGRGATFDRLGVFAPAILSAGAADRVEMYYLGTDGTGPTLGFTERPAAHDGVIGG